MCGPHAQPHALKLPMRCIQRAVTMAGRGRGDVGRGKVQCVYVAPQVPILTTHSTRAHLSHCAMAE